MSGILIEDIVDIFSSKRGVFITDLIVQLKFAKSKTEAKQLIKQKSVKIGSNVIESINAQLFTLEGKFFLVDQNDTRINIITNLH